MANGKPPPVAETPAFRSYDTALWRFCLMGTEASPPLVGMQTRLVTIGGSRRSAD